jgi:YHS domain-containing protein
MLDSMRGRIEASEYAARLSRVAAAAKQRGAPVYAQAPAGTARSAVVAQAPSQTPPAATQPPMANAGPLLSTNGPMLNAGAQPSPNVNPPVSSRSAPNDDRYADYFRRSQATPATPIAQPAPAVSVAQAYPPSQTPTTTAASVGASPVLANPASAYGSQTPPMQPANPQIGNPTLPSGASSSPSQLPAMNQPLGLDGFCPTTLTEKVQWTPGDRRWGAIHRGRTYLFAGPEEQRRFFADPDRYAPAISGNDVVLAIDQGKPVPGMREHGVFYNNRIYLFSNEATLEKFAKNPSLYINPAMGTARPGAYAGQPLQ